CFPASRDPRDLGALPTRRSSDLSAIKELTSSGDPAVFTGVEFPSGQVIRLYAVHPRPPQFGQGTAERAAQLMAAALAARRDNAADRKSTRLNSSHDQISYAAFGL